MKRLFLSAAAALLAPGVALAHPGHGQGQFTAGLAHPLGGADHLLAMVALGLLAAQIGGRATWTLPLAFLGGMLAGGLAGLGGAALATVEPMILASVVILGALVAMAARPPLPVLLAGAAAFGAAHGWAHGAEAPASGIASYAAGFLTMTAALHLAGIGAGRALLANVVLRGIGGGAALAGLALAIGG
ncbi:HupE/UreJ family protein [Paracoccus spongiarum]|uniref:HupE/UreJ family protein n=1 Tax=Paracoccus spongiarum TaxID=3064387 RepID=A0ABT9JAV5_9RHOB|nr:HupE/UreJ family protein [Paracoccus sp. 2205BS29-5]MDP5306860.1 HupE/UreJ family protein [Paracoccus sp. 2205BS29-5]